jgi:orotate phosphoribosyltransferase
MPVAGAEILSLAKEIGALSFGEFTLSSGETSTYYFDGRLLSLSTSGAVLLGEGIWDMMVQLNASVVAGPTIGADPLIGATLAVAGQKKEIANGLLVRPEEKRHGTGKQIEGLLEQGSQVLVVDDVCTKGGSLLRSIDALEIAGCIVVGVMVVLDRVEGGSKAITDRGYQFHAILRATSQGDVVIA